jgi:REP element-mobilizing transposase RayT
MLERSSVKFNIDVIAYALMEWHIHLFVFDLKNKISKFMEELHGRYASFFNRDTGKVGHVFGERYNNKIVQPNEYGLWLSRYIHRQAVEAGLVVHPEDYPWTSYKQYIGLEPIKFIKPWVILEQFSDSVGDFKTVAKKYEEFVLGEEKEKDIDWDEMRNPVIGDLKFVMSQCDSRVIRKIVSADELITMLSNELKVTKKCLLKPVGREQRSLRKEAVRILYKSYRIKISEITRLLKISRFSVMRYLE